METLIFLGLIMGLMYLLMIRPQQRRAQKHQALLRSLKVGDMVVTSAGIHGAVALVDDHEKVIWVEVAPEVELKVARAAIAERISSADEDGEDGEDGDSGDGEADIDHEDDIDLADEPAEDSDEDHGPYGRSGPYGR